MADFMFYEQFATGVSLQGYGWQSSEQDTGTTLQNDIIRCHGVGVIWNEDTGMGNFVVALRAGGGNAGLGGALNGGVLRYTTQTNSSDPTQTVVYEFNINDPTDSAATYQLITNTSIGGSTTAQTETGGGTTIPSSNLSSAAGNLGSGINGSSIEITNTTNGNSIGNFHPLVWDDTDVTNGWHNAGKRCLVLQNTEIAWFALSQAANYSSYDVAQLGPSLVQHIVT